MPRTLNKAGPEATQTVRSELGATANVAVTLRSADIDTEHDAADPEHAPPHPTNDEPEDAEAVSVTTEPSSNDAEHDEPQSIPPGELTTRPEPPPNRDTDNTRPATPTATVTSRVSYPCPPNRNTANRNVTLDGEDGTTCTTEPDGLPHPTFTGLPLPPPADEDHCSEQYGEPSTTPGFTTCQLNVTEPPGATNPDEA